ncbi:hypothetical protein [Nostoc flagelliforme]|uniref:hypothetical protein n=1 Tax=Nostoc flagelliforme TaxID=1306274 RepID=UPI001F5571CB|nr:hypothetical protein [Nostoc flagelliforme]
MPLTSALGYSTFISAKKILSDSGLFIFKPDKSIQDGRETASWMVKNLHGSRMKEFWEKANAVSPKPDAEKQESNAEISEKDAGFEEIRALNQASILGQSQPQQGFQETSRTTQEHLTNSSNELVRCFSDTPTQNLHEEETAHAPLGGASPQSVQSVSEKGEELPAVTECRSLTLVETAPSQSASMFAENQVSGLEAIFPHEGICSAAPVARNEFSSTSAITDQKIEPSCPSAELMTENSVTGAEMKADHECESSAAPVPNPEKWSHEAIVARSNMRPERMQKLKVAGNSGQNPGFNFLQECWNDDPALQIVIKKLLVRFPQWRIAIVDGVLVKWNNSRSQNFLFY